MRYAHITISGTIAIEDNETEALKDSSDLGEDRMFDEDKAFKDLASDKIYTAFRGTDFNCGNIVFEEIKTAKNLLGSNR